MVTMFILHIMVAMQNIKRILILTADAGFGHRSAANAIAAAITEKYGEACTVEIVNPLDDKHVPTFLRDTQTDYDTIVKNAPKLYSLGYDISDATVPIAMIDFALILMLFDALDELLRKIRPDVVITTYPLYQGPLKVACQIRQYRIPLITVVTDLVSIHGIWFHEAADLCLVPTTTAQSLALEHGLAPEKVRLSGIPVHPRIIAETRTPAEVRAALGWRNDLITVLAVGSKRVGNLREILHILNHSALPIQTIIVTGGDDKLYEELQKTEWHMVTRLYNFVDNLPTMMHAANIIMCKAGGLIVSESLACGLPLLLVDVLPGQETGNAEYVIENEAGEWVKSPVSLLETLYHWLNYGGAQMTKRADNARQIGHPRAAYDIAAEAWFAANNPTQRHSQTWLERSRLITWLNRHNGPWKEKSST